MPSEWIDISLGISPASVVWPTAPQPSLTRRLSIDKGDSVNDSDLFMNVHTGTHIDAPLHHFQDGVPADQAPLEAMVGEAWVVDLTDCSQIDIPALERVWPSGGTQRLLCRTGNSRYWQEGRRDFTPDYCALTEETAQWLLDRGVRLVGMDYLSVQRYSDPPTVHRVLLRGGVVLLEGLDLSRASPGRYELLCLPLKLADAEGAPARAVLRRLS